MAFPQTQAKAEGAVATVTATPGVVGVNSEPATANATVVALEVSSASLKPVECRNRHIYGICEQLQLAWRPMSMQLQWNTNGTGNWKSAGQGWRHFQCPDSAMQFSLVASCSGVDHSVNLSVYEPVQVCCQLPPEFLQKLGLGHDIAGDVGMSLTFTVCPANVSFEGVRFMEIPSSEGINSGYFNELRWQNFWYHGTGQGAGRLVVLNEDNDGEDEALKLL